MQDLGLRRWHSAVTVSPSGPPGLFKGVTTATSGVQDPTTGTRPIGDLICSVYVYYVYYCRTYCITKLFAGGIWDSII